MSVYLPQFLAYAFSHLAFTAYLVNTFKPIIPSTTKTIENKRPKFTGSLKNITPTTAAPIEPIPVQIA